MELVVFLETLPNCTLARGQWSVEVRFTAGAFDLNHD